MKSTLTLIAVFAIALLATSARAELYWNTDVDNADWDGSSGLWNTQLDGSGSSGNWSTGEIAVFTTTTSAAANNIADVVGTQQASGVVLNRDYRLYDGGTGLLKLGTNGINTAGNRLELRVGVELDNDQTWSGGDIDIYKEAFNINGKKLTLDTGSQMFPQINAYFSGTGTIELVSGSIRLGDAQNTFSGVYDVSDAELWFSRSGKDYLVDTASVTLRSGAIWDYDDTGSAETINVLRLYSGTVDPDFQSVNTLTVNELWIDDVQQ